MIPPCTCGHDETAHGLFRGAGGAGRCSQCMCGVYVAASTWQSAAAATGSGMTTTVSGATSFGGAVSGSTIPVAMPVVPPPQVNPIHRMLRAEEGRVVVVIVPLANLASMSDVEVWRGIEKDLAYAADEIVIQRDLGEYVVIKDRDEPGVMPKKIVSIERQRKALEQLRDRLE